MNGLPAPQGSKRHVGGGRMVEMSRAVGPWREAVRAEAQRQVLQYEASVPLSVTLVFVLRRPKNHYLTGKQTTGLLSSTAPRFPLARPDLDKLERAVLDGLVAGGLMADDAQVCSINCAKVYAANGEAPGAVIEVEAMT